MVISIAVIGDTHALKFDQIPLELLEVIEQADWLIHVGDYTRLDVLEGFFKLKGPKFIGVCGNADSLEITRRLKIIETITIQGKTIGITHPYRGGPDHLTKQIVLSLFKHKKWDILIYGHTHEVNVEKIENKMLINPGKGYLNHSSASLVLLTLESKLSIEVLEFKPS